MSPVTTNSTSSITKRVPQPSRRLPVGTRRSTAFSFIFLWFFIELHVKFSFFSFLRFLTFVWSYFKFLNYFSKLKMNRLDENADKQEKAFLDGIEGSAKKWTNNFFWHFARCEKIWKSFSLIKFLSNLIPKRKNLKLKPLNLHFRFKIQNFLWSKSWNFWIRSTKGMQQMMNMLSALR